MLSLAPFALLALQAPDATYADLLRAGVDALAADANEHAAELFRAAGERAPGAPVWRAYLGRALGSEAEPRTPLHRPGGWAVVSEAPIQNLVLDPTGERILDGGLDLYDARSGARVTRLEPRVANRVARGSFDSTGSVLVFAGRDDRYGDTGLDVRDARTGRPVEIAGTQDADVPPHAWFEWQPEGSAPLSAVDFTGPDGTLRVHFVPGCQEDEAVTSNADRTRAFVKGRRSGTSARLIELPGGDVLRDLGPDVWCRFSADGSLLSTRSEGRVRVIGTETGEVLLERQLPYGRDVPGWSLQFRGHELVRLDEDGTLTPMRGGDGQDGAPLARLDPSPGRTFGGFAFAEDGDVVIVPVGAETRSYSARTGDLLWSARGGEPFWNGARILDAQRSLVLVRAPDGAPHVVHAATGTPAFEREAARPLSSTAVLTAAGATVVLASDGSLRRVDPVDGQTAAFADEHVGAAPATLVPAGKRILTAGADGELMLRDAATLRVLGRTQLHGPAIASASADGAVVLGGGGFHGQGFELVRFAPDGSAEHLTVPEGAWRCGAVSPSGTKAAWLAEGRLLVTDVESGATRVDHRILGDRSLGHVTFLDEERLAVGWSGDFMNGASAGAALIDAESGAIQSVLNTPVEVFCTGSVMLAREVAAAGRIVYTVSPSGMARAFDTESGEHAWSVTDTGGGNWDTYEIEPSPDGSRIALSGQSPNHARVVDAASGRVLAKESLEGLFELRFTSDGEHLVGLRDGALVVLDAETYTELYRRHEGTGGAAWLERDGLRAPAPGTLAPPSDPTHVTRGTWSAPIDGWDAWLLDPLGLCPVSVSELPNPPVLTDVPPRVLDGPARVRVGVRGTEPLVGLEIRSGTEPARFVRFDEPRALPATVECDLGPGDHRLRVVARNGVCSRPVRISVGP